MIRDFIELNDVRLYCKIYRCFEAGKPTFIQVLTVSRTNCGPPTKKKSAGGLSRAPRTRICHTENYSDTTA